MSRTFEELLKSYREESVSKAQRGTRFERLIRNWFLSYHLYKDYIEEVMLWNEYTKKYDPEFGHDIGIDLVIKTHDGEFWAIQCKFYEKNATINREGVLAFLEAVEQVCDKHNNKTYFSKLFWVQSSKCTLSSEAKNTFARHSKSGRIFTSILYNQLENSNVDWDKLDQGIIGEEALKPKKTPLEHQINAIKAVRKYFIDEGHDRGKLIMACGTGKTYTSLKIVEDELGTNGFVLFLVPSIALLNQTLNAWKIDATNDFKAICICSDSNASRNSENLNATDDLAYPACTDPEKVSKYILDEVKGNKGRLVVVFSTYQSIEAISDAQKKLIEENGFGEFDMVICDEAHRTTGQKVAGSEDESAFVRIHNNDFIKAKKRLYMTATPRLYGDNAKSKATERNYTLFSMDIDEYYGDEIYRVGFSLAVEHGLLTDYKVLILSVDESCLTPEQIKKIESTKVEDEGYTTDAVSRLDGVISALSKNILGDKGITKADDPGLMHRAVLFCGNIKESKQIAKLLPSVSDDLEQDAPEDKRESYVRLTADSVKHIDGSMNTAERSALISGLKEEITDPRLCKILCNVKCLSEGVDVPALDAVIFFSPKNSHVDVVQSVGRVMRNFKRGTPDAKKYGYIIIPVFTPSNIKAEDALNNNKRFQVVWQILNALRSHDDRFNAEVNTIQFNNGSNRIVPVSPTTGGGSGTSGGSSSDDPNPVILDGDDIGNHSRERDGTIEQFFDNFKFKDVQNAIYAKIVEKCGERLYWENWAGEVGLVAQNLQSKIRTILYSDNSIEAYKEIKKEFKDFNEAIKKNLNPNVSEDQVIEMLSQHYVTKPVFEALFEGYSFNENNSLSKPMERIIHLFTSHGMEKDTEVLSKFYRNIRNNISNIKTIEGKQSIIKTLYEKFFKIAFPKVTVQLGIVYTPIECVDFILHSVEDILQKEFNCSISDEGVHILDPFTGTGTFITRLLQSNLIKKEDLERKYLHEIHCNELVLLAYYVADINIETVYQSITQRKDYLPYDNICLTDTFQLYEDGEDDIFAEKLARNSELVEAQMKTPIRVIVGNPPYSVGQKSANDDAQNVSYPKLEENIANTYAKYSKVTNKNSLYDSYIKAIKWASLRLENNKKLNGNNSKLSNNNGIIAFISNGGWLDGNAMDGMRKCLEEEFSSIYVLNLRGNSRIGGEYAKKEGGGVFNTKPGSGCRCTITVTFLIKNNKQSNTKAEIYYYDIGDYLTSEEKLNKIKEFTSLKNIEWLKITPNIKNDWINQRDGLFDNLVILGDKKDKELISKIFNDVYSRGISSSRDSWVYNFSSKELTKNIEVSVNFYNEQKCLLASQKIKKVIYDSTKISWNRSVLNSVNNNKNIYDKKNLGEQRISIYRPFFKEFLFFSNFWNDMVYLQPKLFPTKDTKNLVISVKGIGDKVFSCLITDSIPDLQVLFNSQCFPLYYYEEVEDSLENDDIFENAEDNSSVSSTKLVRKDGITDWALKQYQKLNKNITKEQIFYHVYGLLHSEEYRARFEDDLKKSLPRIPIVDSYELFAKFYTAGKKLAELHLNYETIEPYDKVEVVYSNKNSIDDYELYKVFKMKYPSKGQKDTIIYNSYITIKNIPLEAYEYVVNGRSAIDWILEQYQVTQHKESLIVNDPNNWCIEHNDPKYIFNLILRIINVSLQTQEIVKSLPKLKF